MRIPGLVAAALSLAAVIAGAVFSASADQVKSAEVYVKVENLATHTNTFLGADAREQLAQTGVATGKSMQGARLNLAAAIAEGKATVVDSYLLTIPTGARVRFAPSSRSLIGAKVKVTSEGEPQSLNASVQLTYQGRELKKDLVVPNGEPTAWLLHTSASDPAGLNRIALLTFTRVPPRPAE